MFPEGSPFGGSGRSCPKVPAALLGRREWAAEGEPGLASYSRGRTTEYAAFAPFGRIAGRLSPVAA